MSSWRSYCCCCCCCCFCRFCCCCCFFCCFCCCCYCFCCFCCCCFFCCRCCYFRCCLFFYCCFFVVVFNSLKLSETFFSSAKLSPERLLRPPKDRTGCGCHNDVICGIAQGVFNLFFTTESPQSRHRMSGYSRHRVSCHRVSRHRVSRHRVSRHKVSRHRVSRHRVSGHSRHRVSTTLGYQIELSFECCYYYY